MPEMRVPSPHPGWKDLVFPPPKNPAFPKTPQPPAAVARARRKYAEAPGASGAPLPLGCALRGDDCRRIWPGPDSRPGPARSSHPAFARK